VGKGTQYSLKERIIRFVESWKILSSIPGEKGGRSRGRGIRDAGGWYLKALKEENRENSQPQEKNMKQEKERRPPSA